MKLRHKVALSIYGIASTLLLIPAYLKFIEPNSPEYGQLYITAAHIPPENIQGCTLIYADETRDTAYYLVNDYTYHYPEIGDVVYFGTDKGVVERIEEGVGFYIKVEDDVVIYQGMSGTRVRDKSGNEIAFISQLKGSNHLLCISLY